MSAATPSLSVRVLTFNIWFDQHYRTARTRCIANILATSGADVICLQEVTAASYKTLLVGSPPDSAHLTSNYDVSPVPALSSYFALLLVRKSFKARFATVNLPTQMGRQLVVAHTVIPPLPTGSAGSGGGDGVDNDAKGRSLVVATNHFESLDSRRTRRQQLEAAAQHVLRGAPRWVLCGDFNFCSYQNFRGLRPDDLENTVLKAVVPPHADVWEVLHPQTLDPSARKKMRATDDAALGYTFDSHRNENIRHPEQMRYDRILASVPTLRAVEVSLVGIESVPEVFFERRPATKESRVPGEDDEDDDDEECVPRLKLPPGRPTKAWPPPVAAANNSTSSPCGKHDGDAYLTPHRGGGGPSDDHNNSGTAAAAVLPTTPPLQVTSTPGSDAAVGGRGAGALMLSETTTPMLPRHPTVFPSDHFGVVCQLEVCGSTVVS